GVLLSDMLLHEADKLLHSMKVGMLAERTRLPRTGDDFTRSVMRQVIPDKLRTFFQRTIGNDFFAHFKHLSEIPFPVGHQACSDTGGFEKTHVVGIGSDISVMIQCDLGRMKDLIHVPPPGGSLVVVPK